MGCAIDTCRCRQWQGQMPRVLGVEPQLYVAQGGCVSTVAPRRWIACVVVSGAAAKQRPVGGQAEPGHTQQGARAPADPSARREEHRVWECDVLDTGTIARFGEQHGMHCRCTRVWECPLPSPLHDSVEGVGGRVPKAADIRLRRSAAGCLSCPFGLWQRTRCVSGCALGAGWVWGARRWV